MACTIEEMAPQLRILKNAAANLLRGGASAVVAMALPHFLTRSLDTDRFASWSLILQIAAYAGYLDFGLQTAIARFLAQAMELKQTERRDRLVSTALSMLIGAGVIALLVIGGVILAAPSLFSGIPASLMPEFRQAAIVLGASAAILLPTSAFTGVLIGLHRNEIPALAIGLSRICGAVVVIVASRFTHSLVLLALCLAMANAIGAAVQIAAAKKLLPDLSLGVRMVSRSMFRELAAYCAGLTVWAVGMMLVSGLDVTIVGHFDFASVGFYSVAASLITFFAGVTSSALSALLAPIAALNATGNHLRVAGLVLRATRINVAVNLVMGSLIWIFGYDLLRVWVGPVYAASAKNILNLLMLGQVIRLLGSAYSVALVATGEQNRGIVPALVEAGVNFSASILLALSLGAIGAAWGTLIGGIAGCIWLVTMTMQVQKEIRVTRTAFLFEGVGPALLCTLPLLFSAVLARWFADVRLTVALTAVCGIVTAFFLQRMIRKEVIVAAS